MQSHISMAQATLPAKPRLKCARAPIDARTKQKLDRQRWALLKRIERALETPMLILGFVWLALLIVEFVRGLSPFLESLVTTIWIVFIVDFVLKFLLAPKKRVFLEKNVLTLISLAVPALRFLRVVRALRVLRVARAARGVRMVKFFGSLNRGTKALGRAMGNSGFGYVLALTMIVLFAGAAGMMAFENNVPQGLHTYSSSLWWTAMLLTSIGSEYWPQTGEGRFLCLVISIYGFCVFGYITATLASFLVGKDKDSEKKKNPQPSSSDLAGLKQELSELKQLIHRQIRSQEGFKT
jgi:voltage-gated potassium channel